MSEEKKFYIGTAGWNVPRQYEQFFPLEGSHLERYAQKFNCVEINSSFYRDHKGQTYSRWSATVPEDFRFSVKLSKRLTHKKKLDVSLEELRAVLTGPLELKEKFGVLLIQLAPSHSFQKEIAAKFFESVRRLYEGSIAFEPRHSSWRSEDATKIYHDRGISIVFADPNRFPGLPAAQLEEGGFRYARLHGSPEIYKSNYTEETLKKYASDYGELKKQMNVWCIFDNTTFGYAALNAIQLGGMIKTGSEMAFSNETCYR